MLMSRNAEDRSVKMMFYKNFLKLMINAGFFFFWKIKFSNFTIYKMRLDYTKNTINNIQKTNSKLSFKILKQFLATFLFIIFCIFAIPILKNGSNTTIKSVLKVIKKFQVLKYVMLQKAIILYDCWILKQNPLNLSFKKFFRFIFFFNYKREFPWISGRNLHFITNTVLVTMLFIFLQIQYMNRNLTMKEIKKKYQIITNISSFAKWDKIIMQKEIR